MAEQPLTTVKVLPEEMSGLQTIATSTSLDLSGVPFTGLPSNLNPWPEVYFSGLTYGGEGMDRLTGVRKTMHDAELQVQRERLLAAQQIRTLQELLARERLNFQAVTTKNKAEKEELEGKIPPLQRIIEELNAKMQSARDLFEGEKEALELQLSTEKGKVKGLQALQGADAADMEKKCRMIEDALGAERAKTFETKTKLEGEKTAFGRD